MLTGALQGCTVGLPQENLNPLLVKYHDNKPLSDEEVDIRGEVVGGLGVYSACAEIGGPVALLSFPLLFGCSRLACAENKLWETDKICTCQYYLAYDWDYSRTHELKHCRGYGEL